MPKDVATVWSRELLIELELEEFDLILKEIWLNYFGHVEHSSGTFSKHVIYTLIEGAGKCVCVCVGGEGVTWTQLTEYDCHEWKLNLQQSIP